MPEFLVQWTGTWKWAFLTNSQVIPMPLVLGPFIYIISLLLYYQPAYGFMDFWHSFIFLKFSNSWFPKETLKKYEINGLKNKCQAVHTILLRVLHLLDVLDGWYISLRIIVLQKPAPKKPSPTPESWRTQVYCAGGPRGITTPSSEP